jgi:23S rRNA (uridine2552-2'-O)-methyltransferase
VSQRKASTVSASNNPYKKPDHLTREAKAQGYPARSVFKLEEIDRRTKMLKQGQKVIDLGAAPGSWSMYVSQRVGSSGRVLSVDLTAVDRPLGPNVTFVQGDALSLDNEALSMFAPYDVVLSDMAPNTTGNREGDHVRQVEVFLRAVQVAQALCRPGGSFVGKVFMGQEFEGARKALRAVFDEVRVLRPEGVRKGSVEVFLVGMKKKA